MTQAVSLSRRGFLGASGGLVLTFTLTACSPKGAGKAPDMPVTETEINAYLRVASDGTATIQAAQPEIGQGVKTSLPMIVAEELDMPWDRVSVETSKVDAVFAPQFAGGSLAVSMNYDRLRMAGAKARLMLLQAAAERWGVDVGTLTSKAAVITNPATGETLSYGDVADAAGALAEPADEAVTLKPRKDFTLLGTRVSGVDNKAIVTGQPLFGIDQAVEGMRYASYTRCPSVGGTVKSANLEAVKAQPGVVDAFIIRGAGAEGQMQSPNSHLREGVAIVADSTWNAFAARDALEVEWDLTEADQSDWDAMKAFALGATRPAAGALETVNKGDAAKAIKAADKVVSGRYVHAYVNHATLEPQNATAWAKDDGSVVVWAPTQLPKQTIDLLKAVLTIDGDITMHVTRSGGGFGRRLYNDFVVEAVAISQKLGGPVKLQWTREDDMQNDNYRPGGAAHFTAGLTAEGRVDGWDIHMLAPSYDGKEPDSMGAFFQMSDPEGLQDNITIKTGLLPSKIPTGAWRAPFSCSYAFMYNSFLHECAVAADRDFVDFYVDFIGADRELPAGGSFKPVNTARAKAVIREVAKRAGWYSGVRNGRAMGLSYFYCHSAYVAEIAEVSVSEDNHITVHKVWAVADVGPIMNMSTAENIVQGGIVDGLSTMAAQEITFKNGAVEQTNFDTYPLLRMPSAPEIDVHFIQSDNPPTGLGEPGLPPITAAVTNAVYTLTGTRIRELPIIKAGFTV